MTSAVLSEDHKRELRELKSRADGYLSQCVMWRLVHYGLGVAASSFSVIVAATSVGVYVQLHEIRASTIRVVLSLIAAVLAMLVTFLKPMERGAVVRYGLGIATIACSITVAIAPLSGPDKIPDDSQPNSMRVILSLAVAIFVGLITFLKPLEKAAEYLKAWRVLHYAHIDYSSDPASISGIGEKKKEAAEIIARIHSS